MAQASKVEEQMEWTIWPQMAQMNNLWAQLQSPLGVCLKTGCVKMELILCQTGGAFLFYTGLASLCILSKLRCSESLAAPTVWTSKFFSCSSTTFSLLTLSFPISGYRQHYLWLAGSMNEPELLVPIVLHPLPTFSMGFTEPQSDWVCMKLGNSTDFPT